MKSYKRVLTIAGSDSGGGAGIQADIKTISAMGCYAASAIASVTIQNTLGVFGAYTLPYDVVYAQIEKVLEDIGADAVKTGMLPNEDIINSVVRAVNEFKVRNLVVDPVMISTSGHRLISDEAVKVMTEKLFPLATLITPNLDEAEYISGIEIKNENVYDHVAAKFFELGVNAVLLKSGHLDSPILNDYLYIGSVENKHIYTFDRIYTPNVHGTGCTLASAIASALALGYELKTAVGIAQEYLHKAIISGAEYKLGEGHAPVDHFLELRK